MAASSVTGTGFGDSNGSQKPQNHSSCGCGHYEKNQSSKKIKKVCYIKYSTCFKNTICSSS